MKRFFLFLALSVAFVGAVLAQETVNNIEVVGTASVKAIPELMIVDIPVNIEDSTYVACSNNLQKKLSDLQKSMESAGVLEKQLKVLNFSIRENYEYNHKLQKSVKIGYRGQGNLQIEEIYSADLLQKIIKVLEKNESTFYLRFELSKNQKDILRKQSMEKAVADAKEKAHILSKASAVILGDIIKISYGKSIAQDDVNYQLRKEIMIRGVSADEKDYSVEADLSPKEMSISTNVILKWAIDY